MIKIARGVKKGNHEAFIYAINFFKPFEDLKEYGSDISFRIAQKRLIIDFYVHSEDVIPNAFKKLIRNGMEVREEEMPKSRFNEIYQDYVCSCILRIGKEIFSLLPLDLVLINCKANLVNKATGNKEDKTIISAMINKEIIESLNFNLLDPSESMVNFNCKMSFKKNLGFIPVEELNL